LEEAKQAANAGGDNVPPAAPKQDEEMPAENNEGLPILNNQIYSYILEQEEEAEPKKPRGKRSMPSGTKRKAVKKPRKS
jgi:hypothetical protein